MARRRLNGLMVNTWSTSHSSNSSLTPATSVRGPWQSCSHSPATMPNPSLLGTPNTYACSRRAKSTYPDRICVNLTCIPETRCSQSRHCRSSQGELICRYLGAIKSHLTGEPRPGGEVAFERLNVVSLHIDQAVDFGMVCSEIASEATRHPVSRNNWECLSDLAPLESAEQPWGISASGIINPSGSPPLSTLHVPKLPGGQLSTGSPTNDPVMKGHAMALSTRGQTVARVRNLPLRCVWLLDVESWRR